jgi:long-chain acyl-CoA synthetase
LPYLITLLDLINDGEYKLKKGGFGFSQMAFSGGSTGVPKFIVEGGSEGGSKRRMTGLSQHDLKQIKAKFAYGISQISVGKVKGQIVSLIPGPLYHAGTQVAVFPLYFGGTVVPMLKYDEEV